MPRAKRVTENRRRDAVAEILGRIQAVEFHTLDRKKLKELLASVQLSQCLADELAEYLRYVLQEYERTQPLKTSESPRLGISITDKEYLATLQKFLKRPGQWIEGTDGQWVLRLNRNIPTGIISKIVEQTHGATNLQKALRAGTLREIQKTKTKIKFGHGIQKQAACSHAASLVFKFLLRHQPEKTKLSKASRYRFVSGALTELGIPHLSLSMSSSAAYKFFTKVEEGLILPEFKGS